ncbi:MAG: 8-amino-7-oxononanoate synthase [Sphingomonadales bacterium]|nr:8-amino-7-oxononanoate synthase [Sphingomonadales bacterium]
MSAPFAAQHADLARLEARGRLRMLAPRAGIDFASNDYLGLAASPELAAAIAAALARGVPVGSGGSRLLRGNHPEHEALEAEAADFFGSEAALFLATGYAANSALLSTLPQRGDLVLADELIHASSHEGLRLTRAAHRFFAHNDIAACEAAIAQWQGEGGKGRVWIAIETLYSMDGDFAPLAGLSALALRTGAVLIADEAHATGVFGPGGRGLVATLPTRAHVISLHTCGKALGVEGALLCGPVVLRACLINRARGFIFSTAPSPLIAAGLRAALRLIAAGDALRTELAARIALAERLLLPLGAQGHGAPILPLVLGDDRRTMGVAARLQQAGFDIRGIRPPTVPPGTSRLRIVITRNAAPADITALAAALGPVLAGDARA